MIALNKTAGKAMTQTVDRHNNRRQAQKDLLQKAIGFFTDRAQSPWPVSEEVEVMSGKSGNRQGRVYLRNEGGQVKLYVYRSGKTTDDLLGRFVSKGLIIGVFTTGWQVARTVEDDFWTWKREVEEGIARQR